MKTLYLIRHAEAGNDRLSDVTYSPVNEYDKPLTKLGMWQADKLTTVFKGQHFDRTYTSDYLRAIETFGQLDVSSDHHDVLPEIRELYCECIGRNFGNTDLAEFQNQKSRVQSFINHYLNKGSDNENILVVAHGCFILYLLKQLTDKSFGHDITYTGITKLTFDTSWDFEFFNDSQHLYEPVNPAITEIMNA